MKTSFETIVKGMNLINTHTKECLLAILPQLSNFIGKQIVTQSGTSSKFKIEFPQLTAGAENNQHHNTQIGFEFTSSSIWLKVKLCLNGGSYDTTPSTAFCEYFEKSVYLGELLDGNKLKSVVSFDDICNSNMLNSIHSESEILEQTKLFTQQKETLNKLFASIPRKIRQSMHLSL